VRRSRRRGFSSAATSGSALGRERPLLDLGVQKAPHVTIESAQDFLAAVGKRGFGAEAVQIPANSTAM